MFHYCLCSSKWGSPTDPGLGPQDEAPSRMREGITKKLYKGGTAWPRRCPSVGWANWGSSAGSRPAAPRGTTEGPGAIHPGDDEEAEACLTWGPSGEGCPQRGGVPILRNTQEEAGRPLGGHAKGRAGSPRTRGLSRPPTLDPKGGSQSSPPPRLQLQGPVHGSLGAGRAPAQLLPKPCLLPVSPQPSALKEFLSQKPAGMECPILSPSLSFPM